MFRQQTLTDHGANLTANDPALLWSFLSSSYSVENLEKKLRVSPQTSAANMAYFISCLPTVLCVTAKLKTQTLWFIGVVLFYGTCINMIEITWSCEISELGPSHCTPWGPRGVPAGLIASQQTVTNLQSIHCKNRTCEPNAHDREIPLTELHAALD